MLQRADRIKMEVTPVTGGRFEGDRLKGSVCNKRGFLSDKT